MQTHRRKTPLYEEVKNILNKLQGKSIPSYQGLHAFWLDPDVFKSASLYGHRLIAPKGNEYLKKESTKSCCGSKKKDTNPSITDPAITAVHEPPTNSDIGDCWPSGGPGGGGISPTKAKRSDKSAIIYGLKGKYPFDGSIFPPLLWDAAYKPTSDQIQTIANWIDADCPLSLEEEYQVEAVVKSNSIHNQKVALSKGQLPHKISTNKTNQDHHSYKGLTVRKEIHSLSQEELKTFRSALSCMFQYNDFYQDERSFDFWARIHTNSCQHGWEQFLPWHRLYLYFFEQKLQDYDANIALPYWSWTDYTEENEKSFNNSEPDLGYLPEAYGCFLTTNALLKLKDTKHADGKTLFSRKEIQGLTSIAKSGKVYQSGLRLLTAAGIKYDFLNKDGEAVWTDKVKTVYNILKEINPLWFPNRWPGSFVPAGQSSVYPTKQGIENILAINNWADFGGGPSYDHHFGSLEKVHNGMHLFSGGINPCYPYKDFSGKIANKEWVRKYEKLNLALNPQSYENPQYGWMTDNRTTAFDPIFWAHHSNVDRIWALWQKRHSGKPEEMNGVLAPWSMTVEDTMSTRKLGYIYMKDSKFFDVENSIGIQKFNSELIEFTSGTLTSFSKAEIKIHRVRRGNLPNAHIRVFINTPDADEKTPLAGNENFVEQISTFHGSCYGGPGHCNLPLDKTRTFDFRPLHHHEPRNYKIDLTSKVKKMIDQGKRSISIQLVIVGMDGNPIDNALYIDGVSFNVID